MPPKQPTEIEQLLQRLSHAQQDIEREDASIYQKVDRFDKFARFLVWIGVGIFGLGVWVATQQIEMRSMRAELDARKVTVERVNEMWFMKEHGISNKEDYEQRMGRPAPALKNP